jgi:uncharacterized membrane protein YbhN (UPF0104 family)
MLLHGRLPDTHLEGDSKDVIKLVMGLIGTMAALILGLLIASANSNYNAQSSELQSLSANAVLLDRLLLSYGPEAKGARERLRDAVTAAHDRIWTPNGLRPPNLDVAGKFVQEVQGLAPKNDTARSIQNRAMQLTDNIMQTRLLMSEQQRGAIPTLFLIALIFWICALFLGFGLLVRFNVTVSAALFVGAFSVSSAIFLILELNEPYRGFLQISDAPLRHVLMQIGG